MGRGPVTAPPMTAAAVAPDTRSRQLSQPRFRHSERAEERPMEASSVLMFVLIAGFIWGGFAFVLRLALRKEGAKTPDRTRPGGEPAGSGGPPPTA